MKNSKGFYVASRNMQDAIEQGRKPYANIPQSLLKACGIKWGSYGVEWHHNGNRIAFFAESYEEKGRVNKIILAVQKAEREKGELFFKSKAQAMRAVDELPQCERTDLHAICVKSGKFGYFVCTNELYKKDSDWYVQAKSAEQKEAIERLFEK